MSAHFYLFRRQLITEKITQISDDLGQVFLHFLKPYYLEVGIVLHFLGSLWRKVEDHDRRLSAGHSSLTLR